MPRKRPMTEWDRAEAEAIQREYAPLAGATLVEVRPGRMYDGRVVPEIEVRTASGQRVVVQVWEDPEGNGPGYLCLTEA